jgi:hypothetical protein
MQQSSSRKRPQDESNTGTPAPRPSGDSHQPGSDSIARAAYERYEARGREDGHDVDDWLAAEREFTRGGSASEATTPSNESDAA